MKRCSFCEWIPILPLPVWPLAGQCPLGQNTVVGSMTLLLAVRGNIATRSMSGPPFALQRHRTTVWDTVGEFRTAQDFRFAQRFHKLEIPETFLRRSIDLWHRNTAPANSPTVSFGVELPAGQVCA